MKDFFKIFFILCVILGAFFAGRSFERGLLQQSEVQKASPPIAETKIEAPIEPLPLEKEDSKPEVKLDPNLIKEEPKPEDIKKEDPTETSFTTAISTTTPIVAATPKPALKIPNEAKYKSNEWILINSEDDKLTKKTLEKLELKSLTPFLEISQNSTKEKIQEIAGNYRGTIFTINEKEYGSLILNIMTREAEQNGVRGSVTILRNGSPENQIKFDANTLGYTPENFSAQLIEINKQLYIQVYKLLMKSKVAGILYERLPLGTTKTIGTFILTKTDFENNL